jgi:hypothetical protein
LGNTLSGVPIHRSSTGAIPDFLYCKSYIFAFGGFHPLPEGLFHGRQTGTAVGPILIEHLCLLGNGIDRCAAGDLTHITGSLTVRLCRNGDLIKRCHQLCQLMDGVGTSKIIKRMTAFRISRNPISVRTNSPVYSHGQAGSIHCDQFPNSAAIPIYNGSAAL